jgi:hypothetical protein
MTTSRPARVLAVAGALAATLALGACSADGPDDEGGGGSSGAREWKPGPLDEYQARISGYSLDDDRSQEELQAESERQNRQVEELVASCMQEEGFDYIPVDNTGSFSSSDDIDVEWGTREFAEQYGYAISTNPWDTGEEPEGEEWVDPNADYVSAMSEGEQTAYYEALHGPQVDYVEGEEPVEYDWTTAGCYGAAQHEVYDGGVEVGEFAGLEAELNRYYETQLDDPRIVAIEAEWASCMADAGYDGQTAASEVQNALYTEWEAIQGWNDPEYQAQAESWDWDAEPDGPPAPQVDEAAVKEFTEKEIAMAVADFECQEKVDYVKEITRIDHERQQEFVDQHEAELEAWAQAATAAREK